MLSAVTTAKTHMGNKLLDEFKMTDAKIVCRKRPYTKILRKPCTTYRRYVDQTIDPIKHHVVLLDERQARVHWHDRRHDRAAGGVDRGNDGDDALDELSLWRM